MLTATIMAEIAGRERPIRYPAGIEQYLQRGRYLHALEWRRLLKGAACNLRQALQVSARFGWSAGRIAGSAIARERERSAYRRALQALNAETLKDIGLHRSEIPWALSGPSTTDKLSRLCAPGLCGIERNGGRIGATCEPAEAWKQLKQKRPMPENR